MPRTPASFLGPDASWAESEDGVVFEHVKRDCATALIRKLKMRIARISGDCPDVDDLLSEIRRQTADAGVDGDYTAAADLAELAFDLITTAENVTRL